MGKPVGKVGLCIAGGFVVLMIVSMVNGQNSPPPSTYNPYPAGRDTSKDVKTTPHKAVPKVDLAAEVNHEMDELMRKPNANYYATMCGHQREHAEQMAALNHKSEEDQQTIGVKTAVNCLDSVLGHKQHFPGL
jgi:hypothetical protein